MANPEDIAQGTNATPVNPANYNIIVDRINTLGNKVFDVVDYGATGDGATDDTAAIQAAIDAASAVGGTVFFPIGRYVISSSIELKIGVNLIGSSVSTNNGTELYLADGSDTDMIISDTDQTGTGFHHWSTIKNIYLRGNTANNASGNGIHVTGRTGEGFKLENMQIVDCAENGILLSRGTVPFYGENLHLFANDGAGIKIAAAGGDSQLMPVLNHISGDDNGTALIHILGAALSNCLIMGVKAETNTNGKQPNAILLEDLQGNPVTIIGLSQHSGSSGFANSAIKIITSDCRLSWSDVIAQSPFTTYLYDNTFTGDQIEAGGTGKNDFTVSGHNFKKNFLGDLSIRNTAPELMLENRTHEDGDGGREGTVRFKGEKSGGELSTLATIVASHDGGADDHNGQIIMSVNDGNDGDSPTKQMVLDSVDLSLERGLLRLAETTTPSAVSNYGRFYTKTDNRFYFQDGAGDEHRIVTSDYAGILADDNAVEMTILLVDAYEPVLIFDTNMPEIISNGDFSNNNITIGASADYEVNVHVNAESGGTGKTIEVDVFMIAASGNSITAGGITQANPGVVNLTGHPFNDGDRVKISGVSGMAEVNGQIYTVAGAGANDFQLNDDNGGNINTGGYGAYTSGGAVYLATQVDVAHTHRKFGAGAGDVGSMSGGGIAALTGGDTLEVHMKNISDATDMTTESIQLSIIRV